MIGVRAVASAARSLAHTSKPSMSGRLTSSTTASGPRVASSRASPPVAASNTLNPAAVRMRSRRVPAGGVVIDDENGDRSFVSHR